MRITEKLVVQLWYYLLSKERQLRAVGGETIDVVSGGRENDNPGPDFREAIIFINGRGPVTGDIELHVNSRDWRIHGHQFMPSYNGVVLHVVMRNDAALPTILENNDTIPVIVLADYFGDITEKMCRQLGTQAVSGKPCQSKSIRMITGNGGELLDKAGEIRFRDKADNFFRQMKETPAEEVLYQGIMDALGYTRNRESFRRLGHYCSFAFLKMIAREKKGNLSLQAVLLGMAGLLPSQRKLVMGERSSFLINIEDIWKKTGLKCEMTGQEWSFFKVRPNNYPPRRIAALSRIVSRYSREGMLKPILHKVSTAADYRVLEEEFIVPADDYWRNHLDYGITGGSAVLLGQTRAAEIVQNIILPFFLAYAIRERSFVLQKKVREIFRNYPGRAGNSIIHLMLQRMPEELSSTVNTVRRQQGLLYLYHNYCSGERCDECPLLIMS